MLSYWLKLIEPLVTKILVLDDNRASNTKQSLALARILADGFSKNVIIDITNARFNFLAKLPNFLIIASLVARISRPQYHKYDIIISTGRRLAKILPLAKYRLGDEKTKIITILNPNMNFKLFDYVFLPYHDNILANSENNVVNFHGSLSYWENKAPMDYSYWKDIIQRFHKPYIAFMIGGDSKHYQFQVEKFKILIEKINTIANNMDATLLITTSRRTPDFVQDLIRNTLKCSYYFYNYNESCRRKDYKNPYNSFLYSADYFITTGDSISMISELCETKKPVYLYTDGLAGDKHKKFVDFVIANQSAKMLENNLEILEMFQPKIINTSINILSKLR